MLRGDRMVSLSVCGAFKRQSEDALVLGEGVCIHLFHLEAQDMSGQTSRT